MADWSGHDGTSTARRYAEMAGQAHAHSPSYERLCVGVAGDPDVLARLDTLPAPKRQPNLLFATVRYLGGPVGSWPAFRSFVLDRWDDVAATASARRTQTNEARRCATLLPVLAALPQPLALLEVGASAGLCLQPDRYAYRYAGAQGEEKVLGDSTVVLRCTAGGPLPVPARRPEVAWRRGLDLNPLDPADPDDARWLESLVWPEESERFTILRAALALAAAEPVEVRAGDLVTDLLDVAADAPAPATLVVFHSAVLAYLTAEQRDAFRAQLATLAAARPVVWLANEAPGVVVEHPRGPGSEDFVLAVDGVARATADSHGGSLSWLA